MQDISRKGGETHAKDSGSSETGSGSNDRRRQIELHQQLVRLLQSTIRMVRIYLSLFEGAVKALMTYSQICSLEAFWSNGA